MPEPQTVIPNLARVIKKEDVFKKGAADFVAWARIANYLHTHANGWEFHIEPTPDGNHTWAAPDGTAYLLLRFTGPEGQQTELFPYAITDHRNSPIPCERVSARTLTDAHRRGFCACAAFTFGLGYELWAKEEVEASDAEPAPAPPAATPTQQKAKPKAAPKAAAKPAPDLPEPMTQEQREELIAALSSIHSSDQKDKTTNLAAFTEAFRSRFNLTSAKKLSDQLQTAEHYEVAQEIFGQLLQ